MTLSPDDACAAAGALVDLLGARDFEAVAERFDADMRRALPATRLAGTWDDLIAHLGPFGERVACHAFRHRDVMLAVVRCRWGEGLATVRMSFRSDGAVAGLAIDPEERGGDATARARRTVVVSIPLQLTVPLLLGVVVAAFDGRVRTGAMLAGAAGWAVALALRGPVALLARRNPARAQTIVVGSSGPLEEGVRVAVVALVGRGFDDALSIGLGWATIEVFFGLVNAIVALSIAGRDDERARMIREQLAAQGAGSGRVLAGFAERIFASAYHVGATLLIARAPVSALALATAHSGLNLGVLRLQRSILAAELLVAAVGSAVFAAGLAAFDRL